MGKIQSVLQMSSLDSTSKAIGLGGQGLDDESGNRITEVQVTFLQDNKMSDGLKEVTITER